MSKKAVNKVVVDGVTRLDLTGDSVTPQTLLAGATAHNAAGEQIEGAVTVAPASDTVPSAPDDTGSAGTEEKYARGDHVHPRDATKQDEIMVDGILKGDGSGGISAATPGTDYMAPVAVTAADNGKFLRVVNGAWAAAAVANASGVSF